MGEPELPHEEVMELEPEPGRDPAVRTLLVQRSELPELENAAFYGFAGEMPPAK